jgi:uncharacterized membrane protein
MTSIGFILMLVGWFWHKMTPLTNEQLLSYATRRDYEISWLQLIGMIILILGAVLASLGVAKWLWEMMP